jgi:hypothetical protein
MAALNIINIGFVLFIINVKFDSPSMGILNGKYDAEPEFF